MKTQMMKNFIVPFIICINFGVLVSKEPTSVKKVDFAQKFSFNYSFMQTKTCDFQGKHIDNQHFTGIDKDILEKKKNEPERIVDKKPSQEKMIGRTHKIENLVENQKLVKRDAALPDTFDWRQNTECSSLFHIRKQLCGDCWVIMG